MSNYTPVIIGGTIAIDNVKTPTAHADNVLGGSASFASIACSYYTDSTHLLGVVGNDFPKEFLELFAQKSINIDGIEHSSQKSFVWTGEYLPGMADRETIDVAINVLENWEVKVPTSVNHCPIVVLANMSPDNQLQMLSQMSSDKKFVIADTMDLWINVAREALGEVLGKIDCLVLNEGEAKLLTGESNLILAGELIRNLGPKYVIIKVGEFGSYLFAPSDVFYRIPAYPLKNFVDPTGAGDSFLGALAGYLSSLETLDFTEVQIRDAMLRGAVAASYTCEDFSTRTLDKVGKEDLELRLAHLREMSCW